MKPSANFLLASMYEIFLPIIMGIITNYDIIGVDFGAKST